MRIDQTVFGLLCLAAALVVNITAHLGCRSDQEPTALMTSDLDIPTRYPNPERIVAVGDLHGDIAATRKALILAGAMDDHDHWIGGNLVVVQTGDQLDRGGDELEILTLFEDLGVQARASGGEVHVLNGNHELMNVKLDLRYVTLEGFLDFLPTPVEDGDAVTPEFVVVGVRERIKALRPGGPTALRLANRNVIAIVGDTVFVHGGVLPHVVEYGVEKLNQASRQWIRKEIVYPPEILLASDGPVWSRHYSDEPDEQDCRLLQETLDRLEAARMVVGHTVHKSTISSACGDSVWRVDVGLAAHYGGEPAVLEVSSGKVKILTDDID